MYFFRGTTYTCVSYTKNSAEIPTSKQKEPALINHSDLSCFELSIPEKYLPHIIQPACVRRKKQQINKIDRVTVRPQLAAVIQRHNSLDHNKSTFSLHSGAHV